MQISCHYEIIIWPEYVINVMQVKKGEDTAVFHGGFLSPDISVELITNAVCCRNMSMGLEDISCSSWSQGQLWWEHLLLWCFSPISCISDVTLLYWICLNALEEEKNMLLEVILVCWFEFCCLVYSNAPIWKCVMWPKILKSQHFHFV